MTTDPWSILAGPTSYGLIECEITRYSCLVDGPGISPQTRWRRNQRDWLSLDINLPGSSREQAAPADLFRKGPQAGKPTSLTG